MTNSEPSLHGDVSIATFTFNPFSTNSFVVSANGEAVVVDASAYSQSESDQIVEYIRAAELRVVRLVLTHAHIDHIFDCVRLSAAFEMDWDLNSKEAALLEMGPTQASIFGVELDQPTRPVQYISDGDEVTFGGQTLRVADVPGHSPGSIALIDEANGYVLSGDVLFRSSIGRTDLWQGDYATLMRSIHQVLLPMPDETVVYCGHGPRTTIGEERTSNPFLNP